ncbi:Copper type II ascorbate-dependent monooxygenase, C-terminal domain [Nannocystis exedens]|uniref:Copper type II ascorbate-dependent monooxygenase, C-terminal domain n=1 Tax=Nannocystis exedens TaxID=54 RepID=A0A1I2GP21_9BACT|nr:hypothetical protein [Nannocystis exedens]PCC73648.1 hypothetical protein NAEX_06736 [Nannocystis exedens]SFF18351.1 Copper type II ascorbate-dependent monooxygenase, C-terminal domain [Nannocystis exedens]
MLLRLALLGGFAAACNASVDRAEPTYHRDIAPILADNCVECHRPGGVGPFSFTTYEEVAPLAATIAAVTGERSMPPFNLDNSGACNTYVGARWLDEGDIATLAAWAQAGAPAGEPAEEAPEPPAPWQLDRVDLTLAMPEPYTPDETADDVYRCFVLDPRLREDAFVVAFAIRLGRAEMVHHLTLYALDDGEDEAEAAALDEADAGPGYTCFGDPLVPSRWLVGAGSSDRGGRLPAGTGLRMGAGRKAVLQMHYNRMHGTFPDQTAIDLQLAASVPHEAFIKRVEDAYLELPAGEPAVVETDTREMHENFTLWGVWPHMHELGRQLRVTASSPDGEACLARVDDYQFHWQQFAFYEEPRHVRAGDTLRITCTYDTTGRDTTTTWGYGTADEMCIGFFYVTEGLVGAGE